MINRITKRIAMAFIASTVLVGGFALPALAAANDWERLDDVRFSRNDREHVVSLRGEGQFDRIGFRARGANIRCRNIRIIFRNGNIQYIDRDDYSEDGLTRIDLNGDDRRIDEIHFDCRPIGDDHGRLVIRGRRK